MLTIFTPTYNRAHLLPRLYNSLKSQRLTDFEWLIVDDGSFDNTTAIIQEFINEEKVSIRYFFKENGGKHTAINFGVQKANGDFFLIIDSDDILAENALEIIELKISKIKNNPKICGVTALSGYYNGEIVGTEFLRDDWELSFTDIYFKHKITGDKFVAFKTDVLKKFPFPEPEGVKFIFEAVVWHEMAKNYNVLAINQVLQKKEYLQDGISDSSYKKWYLKSLAYSFYQLIENKTYPFFKYPMRFIWNYIHLGINSKLSGENYFSKLKLTDKIIYLIFYPRAFYSYRNMKKKLVTND